MVLKKIKIFGTFLSFIAFIYFMCGI